MKQLFCSASNEKIVSGQALFVWRKVKTTYKLGVRGRERLPNRYDVRIKMRARVPMDQHGINEVRLSVLTATALSKEGDGGKMHLLGIRNTQSNASSPCLFFCLIVLTVICVFKCFEDQKQPSLVTTEVACAIES